jgi:16S rRNA (guanine966-N2)-methyltransferase
VSTRIVAGTLKGRNLQTPDGKTVRPTSSFLRKVIFDMLSRQVTDAFIADLCAGAGTLGVEAISRGVKKCLFVEKELQNVKIIEQNIKTMKLQAQSDIVHMDMLRFLQTTPFQFDGILLDPPYDVELPLQSIDFNSLVFKKGWIVYQCSAKAEPLKIQFAYNNLREKIHGKSRILLYER